MGKLQGLAAAMLAMLALLASDEISAREADIAMPLEAAAVAATAQSACVRRPSDPERPWLGTWTGSDGDGAVLTLRITKADGTRGRVRGTLVVAGRTFNVAGTVNAWGEVEARVAQPNRHLPIQTAGRVPTLAGAFPFVTVRTPNVYNSVLDGRRFELCGEVTT